MLGCIRIHVACIPSAISLQKVTGSFSHQRSLLAVRFNALPRCLWRSSPGLHLLNRRIGRKVITRIFTYDRTSFRIMFVNTTVDGFII